MPAVLRLPKFQLAYRSAADSLAAMEPASGQEQSGVVVRVEGSAARDVSSAADDPVPGQALLPRRAELALELRKPARTGGGEPYLSFAAWPRHGFSAPGRIVSRPSAAVLPLSAARQLPAGLDLETVPDHTNARHQLPELVVNDLTVKALKTLQVGGRPRKRAPPTRHGNSCGARATYRRWWTVTRGCCSPRPPAPSHAPRRDGGRGRTGFTKAA